MSFSCSTSMELLEAADAEQLDLLVRALVTESDGCFVFAEAALNLAVEVDSASGHA